MKKYFKFTMSFLMILALFIYPLFDTVQSINAQIIGFNYEEMTEVYNDYFVCGIYHGFKTKKDDHKAYLKFEVYEEYFGDTKKNIEIPFYPSDEVSTDWVNDTPQDDIPFVQGEKYLLLLKKNSDKTIQNSSYYCIQYNDIYNSSGYREHMNEWVTGMEITKKTTAEDFIEYTVGLLKQSNPDGDKKESFFSKYGIIIIAVVSVAVIVTAVVIIARKKKKALH